MNRIEKTGNSPMPDYCFTSEQERVAQKFDVQVTGWLALRQKKNRAALDATLADLAQTPHCIVRRENNTAAVFRKNRYLA